MPSIQIGMHAAYLYKDTTGWNGVRWYVVMRNTQESTFTDTSYEPLP